MASRSDDVVLCADARRDDDLDELADLARSLHLLPVGAAGLFAALVRRGTVPPPGGEPDDLAGDEPTERPAATGVLVVVGTANPNVQAQIDQLRRAGAVVMELNTDRSGIDVPAAAHPALGAAEQWSCTGASPMLPIHDAPPGCRAEWRTPSGNGSQPTRPSRWYSPVGTPPDRRQSRSILERLEVTTLRPTAIVHHGAVVVSTDDGRRVAIRPGSFGTDRSLVDMRNAVA